MPALKTYLDVDLDSKIKKLPMDYLLEDFQELGNTKPIKRCFRHALSDTNRELFGIFKFSGHHYDYEFKPFDNLNINNKYVFQSNDSEFYKDYLSGNVISLFHTHTTSCSEPSDIDLEISESLGLPSYIFSPSAKSHFLYYPKSYTPNRLYGRIFIPFFQDCVSFVRDFYLINFKFNFNYIKNWARDNKHSNDKLLNQIKKYFKEIPIQNISYGDLIVFQPSLSPFMHLGIFNSENRFSHHPIGAFPVDELFNEQIRKKVYKVYRYKDL